MQGCKPAGQFKPGTAADTPDPTATLQHRPQLSQGLKHRQVPIDIDMTERLRRHPTVIEAIAIDAA
jgi:hypothetical protein